MRQLIILQGPPGAGKTTMVKSMGLEPFTISSDDIRLYFGGITKDDNGKDIINQKYHQHVWQIIYEIIEFKMKHGEFIILDSTMQKLNDFIMPLKLAKKYHYQCFLLSLQPSLKKVIYLNKMRDDYRVVENSIVERIYENCRSNKIPDEIIPIKCFNEVLEIPSINLDEYSKVHHIGDIHGSMKNLKKYFKEGFKPNEFYIFLGDYFDFGVEIPETLDFLYSIAHLSNVVLIFGNHEEDIMNFCNNNSCSEKFIKLTLPKLKEVNDYKHKLKNIYLNLRDIFIYSYKNQNFLITHGGVTDIYKSMNLLPAHQARNGVGEYALNVDAIFQSHNEKKQWTQVHGHREPINFRADLYPNSINLNSKPHINGKIKIMENSKGNIKVFNI